MNLRMNLKTPLWARLIGWWRRRQFEKRDRAEKLRLQRVPVYQGTIVGKTKWVDVKDETGGPLVQITHRWDCYETPLGNRSVKFFGNRWLSETTHASHINVVTPWLNGVRNINWGKTMADKENRVWWDA